MKSKRYSGDIVNSDLELRKQWVSFFYSVKIIASPGSGNDLSERIEQRSARGDDDYAKQFFNCLFLLLRCTSHLHQWGYQQLKAADGPEKFYSALHSTVRLLHQEILKLPKDRDSTAKLADIAQLLSSVKEVTDIQPILQKCMMLSWPGFFSQTHDPFQGKAQPKADDSEMITKKPVVISVQLNLDGSPLANPQVVRPGFQYTLSGKVKANYWPDGYDRMILRPVSTTSDGWYSLSLPDIIKKNQSEIKGSVIFHHEQASIDAPLSIRLFAQLISESCEPLYAPLIGYDELTVRVLTKRSFPFLISDRMLHEKAFSIAQQIEREMLGLDIKERNNFLTLLAGILNYQGLCAQSGKYKEMVVPETRFRDDLIDFLYPSLGSELIKESHLAGGRVEIRYRDIVAELKVENTISDRSELVNAYSSQAASYASSVSTRLSILAILDNTRKVLPPGLPANSVFLVEPSYHGFLRSSPEYRSRLAVVIIDANTQNPSKY